MLGGLKYSTYIYHMENIKGYMTVKDYAQKKDISVQAVYKQINNKTIKALKLGSMTLVKV